ncbi:MAG: hypothetical protein LBL90_11025 [Prevotellaceae bacterium]|jgi:hypothetical protein|nr:hypothetical protein [Prevotellaceae bacterium]
MASIHSLKKDIDYLISEIISDCQSYMFLHPKDKKVEDAWKIVENAIDLRNQLYERANHPDGKNDRKLVKQHYSSIRKDLMQNAHNLFEKVSALSK